MSDILAWARQQQLTPLQIDCTTAVVLKILDGKCKMPTPEKDVIMELYSELKHRRGLLFGEKVHRYIEQARQQWTPELRQRIHQLRLHAESSIPKVVMKSYKAALRSGPLNQKNPAPRMVSE